VWWLPECKTCTGIIQVVDDMCTQHIGRCEDVGSAGYLSVKAVQV